MGFLWAWIYCCWFTSALFPDGSGITTNASTSWVTSSISVALTLLVSPWLLRWHDFVSSKKAHAFMLVAMVAGTFLMASEKVNGIESFIVREAGAFATGVGFGGLWLLWSKIYGHMKTELSEVAIPLSVLMIPLCVCVVHIIAYPVSVFVILLLPVLSYLLLLICSADKACMSDIENPETRTRELMPEFLRIGIVALIVHMTIALLWSLTPSSQVTAMGGWFGPPLIIGCLIAVSISLVSVFLSKYADIFTMYRWLLPLVAIALTTFAFDCIEGRFISGIFIIAAQIGYSTALYVFFSRVVHAGWMGYVVCLGFGRGMAQLGIASGSLLGILLSPLLEAEDISPAILCLVLLCLVTVSTLALLNRESRFKYVLPAYIKLSTADARDKNADIVGQAPKQDGTTVLQNRDINLIEACSRIASTYGLTPRESDVFLLLAQGRSIPYIRDVLHISKNTVDSHSKNIYRKLGIHSRQELIDMVRPS